MSKAHDRVRNSFKAVLYSDFKKSGLNTQFDLYSLEKYSTQTILPP